MHNVLSYSPEDIFSVGLVGTSLDFHKQKDYSFLVGTEHGKIHKVSHLPSQPRWSFIPSHTMNQPNFFFNYKFCINKCPVNILPSEDLQSSDISLFFWVWIWEKELVVFVVVVSCWAVTVYIISLSSNREEVFLLAACLCTAITAARGGSG